MFVIACPEWWSQVLHKVVLPVCAYLGKQKDILYTHFLETRKRDDLFS